MKLNRIALLGFVVCAMAGCFRNDIRTLDVEVPGMKTAECSKIIQSALSRIEGIVSADPDLAGGRITVKYDSTKLATKNVEYVIVGLGFDANGNPGKPEAKATLPAECR